MTSEICTTTKHQKPADRDRVYRVGTCYFRLQSSDSALLDAMADAWSMVDKPSDTEIAELDVDVIVSQAEPNMKRNESEVATALRATRHAVYARLNNYLHIHGVVLITPGARRILVIGLSRGGKTTLALAMCLLYGWRLVAEDVVFFDVQRQLVVDSTNPISVRLPSCRMMEQLGVQLPESSVPGWLVLHDLFTAEPTEAAFDCVVTLETPNETMELQVESMKPTILVRAILNSTNALVFENGTEVLATAFRNSACFKIVGGSLQERVELLRRMETNAGEC